MVSFILNVIDFSDNSIKNALTNCLLDKGYTKEEIVFTKDSVFICNKEYKYFIYNCRENWCSCDISLL